MKNLNNINNFRRTDLYGDGFVGDDYNGAFIIDKYKNGEFYLVITSNGQGWIMLVFLCIEKMIKAK